VNILVTGGAGFIGRHTVGALLDHDQVSKVLVLDDLSSGALSNLDDFSKDSKLEFIRGDICDIALVTSIFKKLPIHGVIHLAAKINVQDSIDEPKKHFNTDVVATFQLLEIARLAKARFCFVSTCMVYAPCMTSTGILESSPVLPASPYAASKLAAEYLCLSYFYTYAMPVMVIRPFNTYGPFQKTNGEGGVIGIFIKQNRRKELLNIFGSGEQTRDFLYCQDCAELITKAYFCDATLGRIIHGGSGIETSINQLANIICDDPSRILHVPHIHPQSEIMRLQADNFNAMKLLDWRPKIFLKEGLQKSEQWIR